MLKHELPAVRGVKREQGLHCLGPRMDELSPDQTPNNYANGMPMGRSFCRKILAFRDLAR